MESNIVVFYENSKDKNSTMFELAWRGVLCGKIIVPDDGSTIEFTPNHAINPYYARRIAKQIYEKFTQEIHVTLPRTQFNFGAKDMVIPLHSQKKVTDDAEWIKYYNLADKYMGKYRKVKSDDGMVVELMLKKAISVNDAIAVINTFLRKNKTVKFTVSQLVEKPITVTKTMSKSEIDAIVAHVLVWHNTKNQKLAESNDSEYVVPDHNPQKNIDPMIMAKALTIMCGNKQSEIDAKAKAQQKANELYAFVKLLDKDGKFICNIYPNKKAHEEIVKAKIKAEMTKSISRRIEQFTKEKEE